MRSLIAEDDATSRKILQTFLSRYGDCQIAVDGQQAVNAARSARLDRQGYDLICMDLKMPVMNGQEAIREIRKEESAAGVSNATKIIVTTAHTDSESIAGALLSRCDAYLVKPIDATKLRDELRTFGLIR
jgi:two-component system chemotaxis response regulator CheY